MYYDQTVDVEDLHFTIAQREALIRTVITKDEEIRLAKTVYGEDRCNSFMMRSAVIWCVFNRMDDPGYGDTVTEVVTHGAFHGYTKNKPVKLWAVWLVRDVAFRYALEKGGYTDVGRTLPSDYLFFAGRKGKNYFRKKYRSSDYYDWNLGSPENYKEMEEYFANN